MTQEISERAAVCVVGALLADAAACPLHWVYDKDKMTELLKKKEHPEFYDPCQSPFYNVSTGSQSCAGDQTIVLMQSMIQCKGFNKDDYKAKLYQRFGPKSSYDVLPGKTITRDDWPIPGPWKNGTVKEFLKNYEAKNENTGHKSDPNSDAFAKMTVVAALYAGKPQLAQVAEEVTRVLHDDDMSVEFARAVARMLESAILKGTGSLEEVVKGLTGEVAKQAQEVVAKKDEAHIEVARAFGVSCGLPGSFKSAFHGLIKSGENYLQAVRADIAAGGDSAPRVQFIGGFKGCEAKIDGLPQEWVTKCLLGREIVENAKKLAALRDGI